LFRDVSRLFGGAPGKRGTPQALSKGALLGAIAISLALGGCGSSSSQPRPGSVRTGSVGASIEKTPHVVLVYRAYASAAQPVTTESLAATVEILRKRAARLGLPQSDIRHSGGNVITVALPDGSGSPPSAASALEKTALLLLYDWEPNVIGPDGKPASSEATTTGGASAGAPQFGLTEYRAVLRAAKRAPILRAGDTTWTTGCTPRQVGGCIYGGWYLLDTKHERMLCKGASDTCPATETEKALYREGYKPPPGAAVKAVRVNPGTVLVQARPAEDAGGKVTQASPNSWYVVNDDPLLTGADITNPQAGEEESTRQPNVSFGFTSHGRSIFQAATKEIAHRGQEAQLPGVSKEAAEQHFAIVLDGQIIAAPAIDYTRYPEGIDATNGSQIFGDFTSASAHDLADELELGPLPVRLVLVSRSHVPGG
jgi:SecD/SecF fusion protein